MGGAGPVVLGNGLIWGGGGAVASGFREWSNLWVGGRSGGGAVASGQWFREWSNLCVYVGGGGRVARGVGRHQRPGAQDAVRGRGVGKGPVVLGSGLICVCMWGGEGSQGCWKTLETRCSGCGEGEGGPGGRCFRGGLLGEG